MHLIPIPVTPEDLRKSEPLWFPFLARIAGLRGETITVDDLYGRIVRGEVQPILVMDGAQVRALCGVCFYMRENEKVAQWVWMTGNGRREWEHLLPEMERFMSDMGAATCEPICRRGWYRILKRRGYKITGYRDTHIILEKPLWPSKNSHRIS